MSDLLTPLRISTDKSSLFEWISNIRRLFSLKNRLWYFSESKSYYEESAIYFKETEAVVTLRPARDLAQAANFTLSNMRPYYEKFSVDWDEAQIEEMTQELANFDIIFKGLLVGVMRLSFEAEECWLRDLQVDQNYQNRGIGSIALAEAEQLAREHCSNIFRLRVFKISPAVNLYKRQGFGLTSEDERFYYMSRAIS